ncbi:MAG: hypothetical protein HRT51_10270 [Colwellia sp.]|nr:hypothetical protein [Colwellia sp.]
MNISTLIAPFFLALIFSPIGAFYLFNFGGSYFPEIGLGLYVIFISIRVSGLKEILATKYLLIGMLIVFLALIGLLFGNNVLHIYSEIRCFFAILLAMFFLNITETTKEEEYEKRIMFALLFTLFIFVFYAVFYAFLLETHSVKKYFPMIGMWVSLLIMRRLRYNYFIVICLCGFTVFGAYSLYRANIVLVVLAFIWLLSLKGRGTTTKNIIKGVLIGGVLALAGLSVLPLISSYYSSSESHMIHGVNKWIDLWNYIQYRDVSDSESVRLSYYGYIIDNFYYFIIPSGVGYYKLADIEFCHAFVACIDGSIRDNSLLYMVISFGYIITIWLMLRFFSMFIIGSKRLTALGKLRLFILFISVVFLLNITSAIFGELSSSILFGFFLAIMNNYKYYSDLDIKIPKVKLHNYA